MDSLVVTRQSTAGGDGVIVLAPSADLTIYADTVCLSGPIAAPGKTIKIVARVLEVEADAHGKPAALNVDGERGQDALPVAAPKAFNPMPIGTSGIGSGSEEGTVLPGPGFSSPTAATPGDPGHPGKDGGKVEIACFQARDHAQAAPFALSISANGGRGGDGATGQAGADGTQGGKGADGRVFMGWNGQNGGQGGDGKPGAGGSGERFRFGRLSWSPKAWLAVPRWAPTARPAKAVRVVRAAPVAKEARAPTPAHSEKCTAVIRDRADPTPLPDPMTASQAPLRRTARRTRKAKSPPISLCPPLAKCGPGSR